MTLDRIRRLMEIGMEGERVAGRMGLGDRLGKSNLSDGKNARVTALSNTKQPANESSPEPGILGKRRQRPLIQEPSKPSASGLVTPAKAASVDSVDDELFATAVELVTFKNQLKSQNDKNKANELSIEQTLQNLQQLQKACSKGRTIAPKSSPFSNLSTNAPMSGRRHQPSPSQKENSASPQVKRSRSAALPINQLRRTPAGQDNQEQVSAQQRQQQTPQRSDGRLPSSLEVRIKSTLDQIRSTQDEDLQVSAELLEDILKSFASACSVNLEQAVALISKDTGYLNMEVIRSKLVKLLRQ